MNAESDSHASKQATMSPGAAETLGIDSIPGPCDHMPVLHPNEQSSVQTCWQAMGR